MVGKDYIVEPEIRRVVRQRFLVMCVQPRTENFAAAQGLYQGGIVHQEAPIYASKVMLVCPSCGKPTRLAHKLLEDGSKVRLCKKCGETF